MAHRFYKKDRGCQTLWSISDQALEFKKKPLKKHGNDDIDWQSSIGTTAKRLFAVVSTWRERLHRSCRKWFTRQKYEIQKLNGVQKPSNFTAKSPHYFLQTLSKVMQNKTLRIYSGYYDDVHLRSLSRFQNYCLWFLFDGNINAFHRSLKTK